MIKLFFVFVVFSIKNVSSGDDQKQLNDFSFIGFTEFAYLSSL